MRSILLVPTPACRDRLLADGVCGSRPPRAWFHAAQVGRPRGYGKAPRKDLPARWMQSESTMLSGVSARETRSSTAALVLAWSGAAVPEGCDRLARLLGRRLCSAWTLGRAGYLAERAALLGLGEVVTVEGEKP